MILGFKVFSVLLNFSPTFRGSAIKRKNNVIILFQRAALHSCVNRMRLWAAHRFINNVLGPSSVCADVQGSETQTGTGVLDVSVQLSASLTEGAWKHRQRWWNGIKLPSKWLQWVVLCLSCVTFIHPWDQTGVKPEVKAAAGQRFSLSLTTLALALDIPCVWHSSCLLWILYCLCPYRDIIYPQADGCADSLWTQYHWLLTLSCNWSYDCCVGIWLLTDEY